MIFKRERQKPFPFFAKILCVLLKRRRAALRGRPQKA